MKEVWEAERSWRGESSQLIDQQQEKKANFDHVIIGAIYFTFHDGKKKRLSIVQITRQIKFFTLRFLSRQNVESKFVLTNKYFFRNFNPIGRLRVARKPV